MAEKIKLTNEFMKNIKTCGITADNELRSMFFEHQDGTIITLSFKQILENEEKWDKHGKWLDETGCKLLIQTIDEIKVENKKLKEKLKEILTESNKIKEHILKYDYECDILKEKLENINQLWKNKPSKWVESMYEILTNKTKIN